MRTRVTACAALLLTLAACGSDDSPEDAGPPPSTARSSSTSPTPAPTRPAEPVQFRLVAEVDPATADVDCSAEPVPTVATPPREPVTVCDRIGVAYRLEPAAIVGGVESATADVPEGLDWTVTINLDDGATAAFADLTAEIAGTGRQVAIVEGGVVVSAPSVQDAITGGQVQITGNLDQGDAEALAAALSSGG